MHHTNEADGGTEAQRGFIFQTYSILLYLLIRRIESRDLKVTNLSVDVEPLDGEDAKFISVSFESQSPYQVVEIVQCKKRESGKSHNVHAGMRPGDEYLTGEVNHSDFKQWIEKKRHNQSVADILAANDNTFYTAIIFGEPAGRVRDFIPEQVAEVSGLKWYSPMSSRMFPINYKHLKDPAGAQLPQKTFATPNIRQRIRVLVADSPSELEAQCALLLIQYERVSSGKANDIVRQLRYEIENRATLKGAAKSSLLPGDIETIIAPGRGEQGGWKDSPTFLSPHAPPANYNQGESPRFVDFEQGKYAHRSEFNWAWEALKQSGFVVVSGPAGTGKTTLCHYLAYKYLEMGLGERVYYLPVKPALSLDDERLFFEQEIYSKTLFIIDDEHFAPNSVQEIARFFAELRLEHKAEARLVVASTTTYGLTRVKVSGSSDLNLAASIRLLPADQGVMVAMLGQLRNRAQLKTPLSNNELYLLSKGYIGLALILARCAQEFGKRPSWRSLFTSRKLKHTLKNWILERLERPGDDAFFEKEVAPIFHIGSMGLPVTQDFKPGVEALYRAGFLESDETELGQATRFYPESINLAFIISTYDNEREKDQGVASLSDYLKLYPQACPLMCERLADFPLGEKMLLRLCKSYFKEIAAILNDMDEPISLVEVTKILRSIHKSARGESYRLLKRIALSSPETQTRFFTNFIYLKRVKSTVELTNFLDTLYRIDNFLMRRLAQEQLDNSHARTVGTLFALDNCRADEIAACLHALSRYNRKFAEGIYQRLKASPFFNDKLAQAESDPRQLSIWIRFCNELRPLSPEDVSAHVEQHLTANKILNAILQHPKANPMHLLLLRLRRLNPKLAADISSTLWLEHKNFLGRLIKEQPDLSAITNDLYALSRLNHRVAIRLARETQPHICELVSRQDRYSKISSALESLHKNVGLQVAGAAARAIDRERMLPLVQKEDRKIDVVGKFLYCLSQASLEVAAWFEEHLNYSDYLTRIHSLRLRNLVFLIHGFLTAAHPSRKPALLQGFLNDEVLINEFNLGWIEAKNLTEVAFGLTFLLDIPIRRSDILRLLGLDEQTFEKHMNAGISHENSVLHVANGLFAAAKFNLEIGVNALREYVARTTACVSGDRSPTDSSHGDFSSARRAELPKGYEPHNLADLGRLFQIAAAIDSTQAQQLASLIDIGDFANYASEEINLGRLATFINGLNRASRKFARDFTARISNEETWEKQYLENPAIENVGYFALALSQVSLAQAREYIRFVFEYSKNNLIIYLEIEANLMMVSNWLRLLRIGALESADQHRSRIVDQLCSTVELDTRVRHLMEATEALIECGERELAMTFAERALSQRFQIRSVRRLHDWVVLYHKALRIERELNIPGFSSQLFAEVRDWHFATMLGFENQAILIAYVYHLFKSTNINGLEKFQDVVTQLRTTILNAAQNERRPANRSLALILAEAPLQEIKPSVHDGDLYRPWERGLASLLFATVFPNEENPFLFPYAQRGKETSLLRNLNEHTSNIEFGFTLHVAKMVGLSKDVRERLCGNANERAGDELMGVTRWLLQQAPEQRNLALRPYHLWKLLERTVLSQLYLSWEDNIGDEADRTAFRR